jgi:fused signal recognition particle receptor
MSTPVIVGIVAAVVVIVIIIAVARRKKGPEGLPAPGEERAGPPQGAPAPSEESATTAAAGEPDSTGPAGAAAETPAAEAKPEPEPEPPPPPPEMRRDTAEIEAQERLLAAKRERKLQKLRQGLAPTRGGFIAKISTLFKEKKDIDPALLDQIEEALITADVGAKTTEWLVGLLRAALDKNELADPDAVWKLLEQEIGIALAVEGKPWDPKSAKPYCIMVVGVNGVGKTTTIGKLASQFGEQGLKVVLAAADTFRAAAVNQLEIWGRRAGCEVVKPAKEGADPSSVVFDAIKKAEETGADVVIADTAGRLHTQAPLMEELKKVHRVMGKAREGAPNQVLLVLDATTGQNALQQVAEFGSALGIDGITITKLDGTAKGGVLIGICHEHGIPVRFIGIGEAKDDLRDFEVKDFVEALFYRD